MEGAANSVHVVEGELLLGRFTVGERIGRGGFGTVHRAWDERLCRTVAIKGIEGPAADRVLREAHAAARLNHPGIVTLYELGEQNGVTYLVSEHVAGADLRRAAAAAELSDRELAEVGADLCAALAHAHDHGVVHRDIKPENVLLRGHSRPRRGGSGRALLADFGIASVTDEPGLTATGEAVGTLAYMAPEQAAGEPATAATDIYALALTLLELWTSSNPVAVGGPAAVARRIGTRLPALAEQRPELPPLLSDLLEAALAPDPADRPGTGELREGLLAAVPLLHPTRPLPAPEPASIEAAPVAGGLAARPAAALLAAAAVALPAALLGAPGLGLVAALLLAPAMLLLPSPREWLAPAAAPLIGLLGLAPAFLIAAAMHPRAAARPALAGLGWAWTAIAGGLAGASLGAARAGDGAAGWTASAGETLSVVASSLLSPEALALALIWAGAAVLLGLLLDCAGPAGIAVLGLVWAGVVVAALGASGVEGAAGPQLAFALVCGLAWICWDRAGRPRPLPARAAPAMRPAVASGDPPGRLGAVAGGRPLPDSRDRAGEAASRHVRAALHGAGSRAGLP
jgi:eukaryotic-like serine/threonine-protein kinase